MAETLFDELKRYVGFGPADEQLLRGLHPVVSPTFESLAVEFYDRILAHDQARKALEGGEAHVGRLKITLRAWMEKLFTGPWDEQYFDVRCRIGRVHVRIGLPQHYMFGAMNVVRVGLLDTIEKAGRSTVDTRAAVEKMLDLELAIMLHTYREDLLAHAAKTERLATFGMLVGSLGHELRNPLGVIETSLYLVRQRADPADDRANKHLDRIGDQVKLAGGIIDSLLDLIRDRPLNRTPVVIDELVREALALVQRPDTVTLHLAGLAGLPPVPGDRTQLRQALVNLLQNAVQSMEHGGRLTVTGELEGHVVRLTIDDEGPGVDPTVAARLFEPLITTKPKGVGLGLALVRKIVDRHGGQVFLEGGRAFGARFVVQLPLTA